MRGIFGAIAAAALLSACAVNPETGEEEIDAATVLDLLTLTGSVLALVTGSETEAPPSIVELAANGVEDGIAQFCRLSPWDQDTVRRQLDARDPALRPYLIARYGGSDGDVCTDDPRHARPPGPMSNPDLF